MGWDGWHEIQRVKWLGLVCTWRKAPPKSGGPRGPGGAGGIPFRAGGRSASRAGCPLQVPGGFQVLSQAPGGPGRLRNPPDLRCAGAFLPRKVPQGKDGSAIMPSGLGEGVPVAPSAGASTAPPFSRGAVRGFQAPVRQTDSTRLLVAEMHPCDMGSPLEIDQRCRGSGTWIWPQLRAEGRSRAETTDRLTG